MSTSKGWTSDSGTDGDGEASCRGEEAEMVEASVSEGAASEKGEAGGEEVPAEPVSLLKTETVDDLKTAARVCGVLRVKPVPKGSTPCNLAKTTWT